MIAINNENYLQCTVISFRLQDTEQRQEYWDVAQKTAVVPRSSKTMEETLPRARCHVHHFSSPHIPQKNLGTLLQFVPKELTLQRLRSPQFSTLRGLAVHLPARQQCTDGTGYGTQHQIPLGNRFVFPLAFFVYTDVTLCWCFQQGLCIPRSSAINTEALDFTRAFPQDPLVTLDHCSPKPAKRKALLTPPKDRAHRKRIEEKKTKKPKNQTTKSQTSLKL